MAIFWEIAARSVGHMFSLSFVYLYFFLFIFHFCFLSGIWLLIAPVPIYCFSITFIACTPDDFLFYLRFSVVLFGTKGMSRYRSALYVTRARLCFIIVLNVGIGGFIMIYWRL